MVVVTAFMLAAIVAVGPVVALVVQLEALIATLVAVQPLNLSLSLLKMYMILVRQLATSGVLPQSPRVLQPCPGGPPSPK